MKANRGESNGIVRCELHNDAHVAIELQEVRLLNEGANLLRRVSAVRQQSATEMHRCTTRRSSKKWKMLLGIGGLGVTGAIVGGAFSARNYLHHASVKAPSSDLANALPSFSPSMRILKTMPAVPPSKHRLERLQQRLSSTPGMGLLAETTEPPPHNPQIEVQPGGLAMISDADSDLFTQNLFHHTALTVLSDWNGHYYAHRTLMHFVGNSLRNGLVNDVDTESTIVTLQHKVHQYGGKVIVVWGSDSPDFGDQGLFIGQLNAQGTSPLLDLIMTPSVSCVLVSAIGITVHPDGTFQLQNGVGSAREFSDEERCGHAVGK